MEKSFVGVLHMLIKKACYTCQVI